MCKHELKRFQAESYPIHITYLLSTHLGDPEVDDDKWSTTMDIRR